MICDKCGKDVAPQNNALLYDAALSALIGEKPVLTDTWESTDKATGKITKHAWFETGYNPKTIFFFDYQIFQDGEIVYDKPEQSVKNVMKNHFRARHLYPTDDCEGSPSRRQNIEQGTWCGGVSMGDLSELPNEAYKIIQQLESEICEVGIED
jgi:hypothetical protein